MMRSVQLPDSVSNSYTHVMLAYYALLPLIVAFPGLQSWWRLYGRRKSGAISRNRTAPVSLEGCLPTLGKIA